MTVDMDLGVDSRPALLVLSVLQTTSEIPYSCQPRCFMDQNTEVLWRSKQHRLENRSKSEHQLLIWVGIPKE